MEPKELLRTHFRYIGMDLSTVSLKAVQFDFSYGVACVLRGSKIEPSFQGERVRTLALLLAPDDAVSIGRALMEAGEQARRRA